MSVITLFLQKLSSWCRIDFLKKYVALRRACYNNDDLNTAAQLGIKVVRVYPHTTVTLVHCRDDPNRNSQGLRWREGNFLLIGTKNHWHYWYGEDWIVDTQDTLKRLWLLRSVYPSDAAEEHGTMLSKNSESWLDRTLSPCPLTEYIINDNSVSLTKKGVVLINTSRGGLIDTYA